MQPDRTWWTFYEKTAARLQADLETLSEWHGELLDDDWSDPALKGSAFAAARFVEIAADALQHAAAAGIDTLDGETSRRDRQARLDAEPAPPLRGQRPTGPGRAAHPARRLPVRRRR